MFITRRIQEFWILYLFEYETCDGVPLELKPKPPRTREINCIEATKKLQFLVEMDFSAKNKIQNRKSNNKIDLVSNSMPISMEGRCWV
jgi:hypothetical protein